MPTTAIDQERVAAFTGRVLTETAATTTIVLAAIGDRLGLFRDLAAHGPATSAELAGRTGTNERYIREWLAAMFAAGYVTHDPVDGRFALPAEHAPVLVEEPGPTFFGGVHQELLGVLRRYDVIVEAFRHGGGVALGDYHPDLHEGVDRFTAQWHENLLVREWIARVPQVEATLRRGGRLADVGCGQGRAIVKLAQTFPAATLVGYDLHPPNIERARALARDAGVAGRVEFHVLDVAAGLPERFDVVSAFDVVHDAADPLGMLRAVRAALEPGGVFLCLEINCSDRLEDNVGPIATLLYGFSVMLCMPVSLAEGGAGLGTLGLPEPRLRELADRAGFAELQRIEMDNPFNALYALRR
jgi:SAM-dependent methyltransferase